MAPVLDPPPPPPPPPLCVGDGAELELVELVLPWAWPPSGPSGAPSELLLKLALEVVDGGLKFGEPEDEEPLDTLAGLTEPDLIYTKADG